MRHLIICNLILFFTNTVVFTFAQAPPIQWAKCYGGSERDEAWSVLQTIDGGFIIAGETGSNDGDVVGHHPFGFNADMWIIKVDDNGNLQWQKCFGGLSEDEAKCIQQTQDSGFIIAGTASSFDGDVAGGGLHNYSNDYWIVKTDSIGTIQWQKCYGGSTVDWGKYIYPTSDGGYIITGDAGSSDGDVTGHHSGYDAWVVKIDSVGTILWAKSLGGTNLDRGVCVEETEGGYIVGSNTFSNDGDVTGYHGDGDMWIVKLDSAGNIISQKCYGGSGLDVLYKIVCLADHKYFIIGTSNSNDGDLIGNHGDWDGIVMKIDSDGSVIWQKCYGGMWGDHFLSASPTADSGLILVGYINANLDDFYMVKIDSLGNQEWDKSFGGSEIDNLYCGIQTRDSGFFVVGSTQSNDGDVSGNHAPWWLGDFWIAKLGQSGNLVPDQTQIIRDFSSYFNHENKSLYLNFYSNDSEGDLMQLLDLTGRILIQKPLTVVQGFNKYNVVVGDQSRGIYLLQLISDSGVVTKKFLIQ